MQCRLASAVLMLGFLAFAPMQAQDGRMAADDLRAGTRVRVTMNTKERVVGTVVVLAADSVVIAPEGGPGNRSLLRTNVARVELSAGKRSSKARGARMGLLAGAAVGAVYGVVIVREEAPDCINECAPLLTSVGLLSGAVVLGLVGTALGALAGAPSRERWIRAPDDGGIPLSISPTADSRIALRISLRL